MTENELAANAQAALDKLRADEAEITADIDRLEVRLEVVRETIALLSGVRRGRPKGAGRRAASPPEPSLPELEPMAPDAP